MVNEDPADYSSEVIFLLEGISSGRLQIVKLDKTVNKNGNKFKYTIAIADTAIPAGKKKKQEVVINQTTEEKTEKPKTQKKLPVVDRPAMCNIVKID